MGIFELEKSDHSDDFREEKFWRGASYEFRVVSSKKHQSQDPFGVFEGAATQDDLIWPNGDFVL